LGGFVKKGRGQGSGKKLTVVGEWPAKTAEEPANGQIKKKVIGKGPPLCCRLSRGGNVKTGGTKPSASEELNTLVNGHPSGGNPVVG